MQNQIKQKIDQKDYKGLMELMATPEALSLSYDEKNKYFVTSHKLQDFGKCSYGYYLRWIAKVESNVPEDSEALLIGQAFDDLVTDQELFYEKYEVLDRRVSDVEGEIADCIKKIAVAAGTLNKKDNKQSVTAAKTQAKLEERLKVLEKLKTKTQITNSMFRKIAAMKEEFEAQELFNQTPKKKIFICEFSGIVLKIELDDIDEVKKRLIDVKTTANITTFDPMNYLDQMTFYQWVIEEVTGEKYTAVLEVVDKNDYFSRSAVYEFCRETLEANRGKIIRLLEELKIAQESGIWIPTEDQQVLWSSPYYGFEGYGRMKKIINL
jgi:hypothetical protein